jgi:hypothetical protein
MYVCRATAESVAAHPGFLSALSDHLQQLREVEGPFMAALTLVARLVAEPQRAAAVGRHGDVVAKWEGVARVLALRRQAEKTYLIKLEAEKVGALVERGGKCMHEAVVH